MKHWTNKHINWPRVVGRCFCRHGIAAIIILALGSMMPRNASAQMKPGQVDIFMGVDFNYRDMYMNGRVFDFLVNLTPSVKWRLPYRWEVAGQVFIPVINQYGHDYKYIRPNIVSVSKQFAFLNRLRLKLSGGLFSFYRYGFDAKAMLIANRWLAFTGQVGFTGYCSMVDGWHASQLDRLTFLAGPDFWIAPWNSEIWVRGGRFTYGDYGVMAEGFRHFRHVSVGLFAGYGNLTKENAGFKIVVMLPPYKRTRRTVNFRPASNFKVTYRNDANMYGLREYATDPEQNERTSWFDRDMLPWGTDTMEPDFVYREKRQDAVKEAADSLK
ncbi:MAG: hypothetical protein NC338_08265 [Firmicutes bacterium]|nr:hypothetical protein [Bacillota bacterium]MCM1401957.1 hypothetical protein [Bacteroides sp.]MCM1477901.1 hypothetical protein [Bacteroides sp.]